MQTRRRLHPQDSIYQTHQEDEGRFLIPQQQHFNINIPNGAVPNSVTSSPGIVSSGETQPLIPSVADFGQGNHNNFTNSLNTTATSSDSDDKYNKANRPWNLRSISNRLQVTSGNALRTFIQQPLSAAAAVVTGNHQEYNNNSNYNYSDYSSAPTSQQQHQQQQEDNSEEDFVLEKESVFVMAARDRTSEFTNAIRSLQSRNITRAVNIRDPRKAKQVQSFSEFMMVAKYVGKNIASTYAKLEKLTLRKYF